MAKPRFNPQAPGGPAPRRRKKAVAPELAEQTSLFAWADRATAEFPALRFLFHVPNGELRDAKTAALLKAAGVRPGVPDVFLDVPVGGWHGLRIELKRPEVRVQLAAQAGAPPKSLRLQSPGSLSPEQLAWAGFYRAQGFAYFPAWGWHEAKEILVRYLRGNYVRGGRIGADDAQAPPPPGRAPGELRRVVPPGGPPEPRGGA